MNSKRMLVPIGAFLVLILIVAGGFLIFIDKSKNSGDSGNSGNEVNGIGILYAGESEKPAETYTSNFGELKKTADLGLKVGDRYYFHYVLKRPDTKNSIFFPDEYDTMVEVKRVDRVNKSDYYVMESSNVSIPLLRILGKKDGVWKELHVGEMTTVVYSGEEGNETVQKEVEVGDAIAREYEGCIIGINKENGEMQYVNISFSLCPVLYGFYEKWMLYLDKDVK